MRIFSASADERHLFACACYLFVLGFRLVMCGEGTVTALVNFCRGPRADKNVWSNRRIIYFSSFCFLFSPLKKSSLVHSLFCQAM